MSGQVAWIIGSAADCHVVVTKPIVSGHHCKLSVVQNGFLLEDLDSTNGTYVNGHRLTEPTVVSPEDDVTLGREVKMPWPRAATADMVMVSAGGRESREPEQLQGGHLPLEAKVGPQRASRVNSWLVGLSVMIVAAVVIYWLASPNRHAPVDIRERARFTHDNDAVLCAKVLGDTRTAVSAGDDKMVYVWNLRDGQLIKRLRGHTGRVIAMTVSSDGKRCATASHDGTLRMWSLRENKDNYSELTCLRKHDAPVQTIAFYPNPGWLHLFVGGKDGTIRLWDLSKVGEEKVVRVFGTHSPAVTCLAVQADGLRFASGGVDGRVRLWDFRSGREVFEFAGHRSRINSVAFSPDERLLISASDDGTCLVWNVDERKQVRKLRLPSAGRYQAKWADFSAGTTRALTGGSDGVLRLWSLESEKVLSEFLGHKKSISCCGFVPNTIWTFSGSCDGTVRIWRWDPPEAEAQSVERAARRAQDLGRELSAWSQHMNEGQTALDSNEPDEAIRAFENAAKQVAGAFPLEHERATAAARDLREGKTKRERYLAHLERGKQAIERGDYRSAVAEFEDAKTIFPDRTEADEPLRRARQGLRLSQFKSANAEVALQFDVSSSARELLKNRKATDFAVMFVRQDNPPMGLTSSPLKWRIRLSLERPLKVKGVFLLVRVIDGATNKTIAQKDHPLDPDKEMHVLEGTGSAPQEGWENGTYFVETFLRSAKNVEQDRHRAEWLDRRIQPPQAVQMGVLRWNEGSIVLTPQEVHAAGYSVPTKIVPDQYDGFRIEAQGSVTPVDLGLSKILAGQKTSNRLSVGPVGVSLSASNAETKRYRSVQQDAPFGALLFKFIKDENWRSYEGKMPSDLLDRKPGGLLLSINSITDYRPNLKVGFRPIPKAADRYWQRDGGEFNVRVLVGKFDLPTRLHGRQLSLKEILGLRWSILKRFD